MSTRRALFMAEHIGGHQYRLRIRDNHPADKLQWFVFDRRSNSIRAWSRRNFALANQRGYGFRIGVAATMRQFDNSNTVRIRWYNGSVRNLRNNGQKCLDVHGRSNTDNRHVIFWNCHNGANQGWILDQSGETYRRHPFNGRKFQLRSRMSSNRALAWYSHIGGHQYRLVIQNVLKPDNKQWWSFDIRTRTIRAWSKRSYAISNQRGQFMRHNRYAVIRQFVNNDATQRLSYFPGSRRNLRNSGGHCLDVHGGHNSHNRKVIFWSCHNGLNQSWYIDQKDVHFPRYPLRNGQFFQIRSRMSTGKAVVWTEHIGYGQYRLRIQNNAPYDVKQWWTFDYRTRSIRSRSNRNLVMSVQYNGNNWYYYHYAAVARPFRGARQLQNIRWFNGRYRNLRDLGHRCLDVHGKSNTHRRHLIWYKCHNGANQSWWIDRRGVSYPKQPVASGVRFQIRSRMAHHRSLFWHEHIGSSQFRLRIRDHNPTNWNQWWAFDRRTNSIRAWNRRSYAIANQKGYGFRIGVAATIRPWTGDHTMKIQWHSGSRRNIRNLGQKCLDVHGNSNTHHRHVIFYNCHNGLNQAWFIDQTYIHWRRQPLPDGRRFQLRSRMSGGRALSYHEHIGGNQFRMRIQNHSSFNDNQWFVFDARTRSIRGWKRRNYAISNRNGYTYRMGQIAVLRPWANQHYQRLSFFPGSRRNLRNYAGKCLDV